ncbi:MAG TPA: hypothetical protein VF292_13145 [Rhodanobacteraceae bacterium]
MNKRYVQIRHQPTGAIIAAGPLGWGIMPFEGNYYIRRRYLREGHFRADYIPGVCVHKALYIGLNYIAPNQTVSAHLGWLYWLPNLLFPFIVFRVALPRDHPLLSVEAANAPAGRLLSHPVPVCESARPGFRHTS